MAVEEVIDNPIIVDKDFDYTGSGKLLRAKNPNEPIFSVVGHSLKVSITAVIVDNDQTLVLVLVYCGFWDAKQKNWLLVLLLSLVLLWLDLKFRVIFLTM